MKTVSGSGPRPKKKCNSPKKQSRYSPSKVSNALRAVDSGMSVSRAGRLFGVPRTTLWNKVNNVVPKTATHPGPVSILPVEVEINLKDYILHLARRGFPLDRVSIADSVKKIVEAMNLETPFVDNRPSRKWMEGFLRRHPEISVKHAEHLGKARSLVTERSIRNWHAEVLSSFATDGIDATILEDSRRVWNCDETAIFLAPKGQFIFGPRNETVYSVSENSDKECVTVLFTVNASGTMAPPLALFGYERLPADITANCPDTWGIGKSERGWMTGQSFFEYVANVFLPFLKRNKIPFPIVLFLDGHKSHITKHLNDLCNKEGIVLVALLPNATAILQPLDVSVFKPLKASWLKTAKKWRIDHEGQEITKHTLCTAVDQAMHAADLTKAIVSGFRATGLFPYNADNVDYSKCVLKSKPVAYTPQVEMNVSYLDFLEARIAPTVLEQFKILKGEKWTGDTSAAMLYDVWKQFLQNDQQTAISEECLFTNPVPRSEPEQTPQIQVCTTQQIQPSTSQESDNDISSPSVHSIFEQTLFWPGTPKKKTTRKRLKMPSVLTGSAWKAVNDEKKRVNEEKEIAKKERLEKRLQKRREKEAQKGTSKKKRKVSAVESAGSASEDDPSLTEDVSSDDEVLSTYKGVGNICTDNLQVSVENLKQGTFVLVEFKAGNRQSVTYTYVCVVQRPPEEDEDSIDVSVMALKCLDKSKTTFSPDDTDVSFVTIDQIKSILPQPKILMNGNRMRYVFCVAVDSVFERA